MTQERGHREAERSPPRPPVLRRMADPRLTWSAYLVGVALGLIVAGGLIALLMLP